MNKIFSETFLDIISKHIPNKIITCNDKYAPWITQEVKTAIKRNSCISEVGKEAVIQLNVEISEMSKMLQINLLNKLY